MPVALQLNGSGFTRASTNGIRNQAPLWINYPRTPDGKKVEEEGEGDGGCTWLSLETNEEAAWPKADVRQTRPPAATEARPMALDFEAPNETSQQETRETQETQEKTKRGEEKGRRRTARDGQLRDMGHEAKEKPTQNNELSTPSYLQTTTAGNQLSMDTIIDAVLGQYTCPEQLLNHTKHIKSFADVLVNYKKRHSESIHTISSLTNSQIVYAVSNSPIASPSIPKYAKFTTGKDWTYTNIQLVSLGWPMIDQLDVN